jgi:hypothetical protein
MAEYNREKALAVVTGIVCALIFLAGTALGAVHSLRELGAIGVLSVACYLIADVAVMWAAYIDYREDGNAMEWAAWFVKYALSLYLLFSGGSIAYLMMSNAQGERATMNRQELYQKTYDECIDKGGKPPACRKLASEFNAAETQTQTKEKDAKAESAGWINAYVSWPLFKYAPGLLGLVGMIVLTLVSKISPPEHRASAHDASGQSVPMMGVGTLRTSPANAPLHLPHSTAPASQSYPEVGNGKRGQQAASFRLKPSGRGYSLNFRHGGRELYGMMVSAAEAPVYATMKYKEIARAVIDQRRGRNPEDATAAKIEATI